MKRYLFPLVMGLGGLAVLLWLGFWQLDRLAWKESVLADIDAKLSEPPVPLPDTPDPVTDNYRSVIMQGRALGEELRFLNSGTAAGTGHQMITAFETTDGRRVLLDRGLLPLNLGTEAAPLTDPVTVQGNLLWPDDGQAQPPEEGEWYGRDVVAMAQALGTEPLYVVLSATDTYDPRLEPLPLDTRNIKNDHMEYAITWFLLAVVWTAMTLFYILRVSRQKDR